MEKLINKRSYPFFESVRAGLPFSSGDEPSKDLDITSYLIDHPTSTYLVRVKGDSMENAGILEGDVVVVDRSLSPSHRDAVIASVDGGVTLKWYERRGGKILLVPANPRYSPIVPTDGTEILGVVIGVIRKYR